MIKIKMFYSDEEDEIANSKKSNKLGFDEQEKENMYRDPLELVHPSSVHVPSSPPRPQSGSRQAAAKRALAMEEKRKARANKQSSMVIASCTFFYTACACASHFY